MTLITDYLLGTLSEIFAILLLKRNSTLRQTAIALWAGALMAVAAASYTGGTYHGFSHLMSPMAATALWKATTISMGAASFLLVAAVLTASFSRGARRWLIAAAGLKLAIYTGWMLQHDEFRFVIYDYGSALAVLFFLAATDWTHGVPGHRAYIAAGVAVSIAAALVQQSGIRLHDQFNHNDLMHVVQMAGVWLLFQAGARLRDAGGDHGNKP
jgi:hypothetical protein